MPHTHGLAHPASRLTISLALLLAAVPAGAAPRVLVSAYVSDDVSVFAHPGGTPLGELGAGGSLDGAQATRVGPDGYLYVANEEADDIVRYDRLSGAFVDVFVAAGSGGLDGPTSVTWGPDGDLFVASFNTDSILRFDGRTGLPMGDFVTGGSGTLDGPDAGTTFGPDGHLYVPSYWNNRVLKYDGGSGASLGTFIAGVPRPRDLEFRPDGYLYVSTDTGNDVRRYDAITGAPAGKLIASGAGGLAGAYSVEFDDLGFVYVASLRTHQILKYRASDGAFVDVFVDGGPLGIDSPTYVTFVDEDSHVSGLGLAPGNANRFRVHDAAGQPTPVDVNAYGAGSWGVNVAGGNVAATERGHVLTGPGPGDVLGPQVRAFLADGTAMGKVNYYAYGTLRYGVNVSAGDVDGDGFDEIVTGPGEGAVFGPHVRGFDVDGASVRPMAAISFFAYGTLKYGVVPGRGDVDADGRAELLTGPGPGVVFGPQVRGFDYAGTPVTPIAKINFNAFSTTQYGVSVAGGQVDADDFHEMACAPGPGPSAAFAPRFLGFGYDAVAVAVLPGFDVTLPTGTTYGGRVALGDVTGDRRADLLAGAGRDPAADATVRTFAHAAAALDPVLSFDPFPGSPHGVNVGSAGLGH